MGSEMCIRDRFKGSFNLDDELFEELEDALISSDIGIDASLKLIEQLKQRVKSDKIQTANEVIRGLQLEIENLLIPANKPGNPTIRLMYY